MASASEPSLEELLWTAAAARVLLGADMHIQAPPNLSYDDFPRLLEAGIDDWGGVSPVTLDHVNPEAPWPEIERLRAATEAAGLELAPRLAVYPEYVADLDRWADPAVARVALTRADASGLAREDAWHAGSSIPPPAGLLSRLGECREAPPPLLETVPGNSARVSNGSAPSLGQSFNTARVGTAGEALAKQAEGLELDEDDITALFEARGRELAAVLDAAERAPPRGQRRHGQLRRHAERQLHERLLLPLRLLRLLQGEARREPAREAVRRHRRGDRPPRARGLGARRDRDLPPGRHPPRLHRRHVPRDRGCGEGGRPGDPRPRVLGARGLAGRGDARPRAARLPGPPARGRSRLAPRHGRGDPRRRRPGRPLPGQGEHGPVARGARRRAPRRARLDHDDHVRLGRGPALVGAPPDRPARAAEAQRRLHRVRPAPVRAHGGADRPQGPRPLGPDLPRGAPHARGRPARAPPLDHERPGVLGQARRRRRAGGAARGRERPRRDAHERVDLPRGRRRARAGAPARGDGARDPRDRAHSAPADDALRHARRRANTQRRSAPRRSPSRSTRA